MRKIVSFLILPVVLFTLTSCSFSSRNIIKGKGKRTSLNKVRFVVWKDSCNHIIPNLRLCHVASQINSQNTWLLVYVNSGPGLMVYYNSENNNIYVELSDLNFKEKEIIYAGKVHMAHAKSEYYHIGKARIKDGTLEPTFLEGTQISYEKRMRNFFNPFDYDYLYRVYINVPGVLKPAFVTYHAYIDGELIQVLDQETQ